MTRRGRIARFDGRHRGRHESLEKPFDVSVEQAVLDRNRSLRRESAGQLQIVGRVGDDLPFGDLCRRQRDVGRPLAVDELKHAHDFVAVRLHR